MQSLAKSLQEKKYDFDEIVNLSKNILAYIPNVLTDFNDKNHYRIYSSNIAGTMKYVRPINMNLFCVKPDEYLEQVKRCKLLFDQIKNGKRVFDDRDHLTINKTIYTTQQSIGAGLDLLSGSNSARKHAGNRFEELISAIFTEIGITNKKLVLQIPYETDEGDKIYKCENDLIITPFENVQSKPDMLDKDEVVVSIKTTSKDRMGKIFIDKMLLTRFVKNNQKVIGIFLNDVQRKESDNISYTLVSGLFMVYTKFLTELDGIYYLDPPPNAMKKPFSNHMNSFSKLITEDVFELLTP